MVSRQDANKARQKRHTRVRGKISGTAECPRLNVYRSLSNIYVQLIDDVAGVTIASASTVEKEFTQYGGNVEAAKAVGKTLAERAKAKGIEECVFDRGGYVYHGRVAAVADGAREGGLKSNEGGKFLWQRLTYLQWNLKKELLLSTVYQRL